jgi:hypothetical protein
MANVPNHRNRYTGEVLANAVEVCPKCHRNFASTRAGDQHRKRISGVTVCLDPLEAGLEMITNRYGSLIYRVPRKPAEVGITEAISKRLGELPIAV